METQENVTIGYALPLLRSDVFPNGNVTNDTLTEFLSQKTYPFGRLLLTLKQHLVQTKFFDRIDTYIIFQEDRRFRNGSFAKLHEKINRSEIDIGFPESFMTESSRKLDFTYPFRFRDFTFVTRKPEYKAHIFGIFETFSLPVWITLASVFIAMTFIYYCIFNRKWNFSKNLFHVLAVLVKQNALIIPCSFAEKLLVYAWVFGTMFLCLSYDSVFLSFLSFPPLTIVKHLSELASAVRKGDFHCFTFLHTGTADYFLNNKEENLRVLGEDILRNHLRARSLFVDLFESEEKTNLAFITETWILDMFAGQYFISEDRFNEKMNALWVRKGFCCKQLLETFVHRMMASGIYIKYFNDFNFVLAKPEGILENSNRKLTLTDVAPAFIFLIGGYFLSFLVLIGEISSYRRNIRKVKRNMKKEEKG